MEAVEQLPERRLRTADIHTISFAAGTVQPAPSEQRSGQTVGGLERRQGCGRAFSQLPAPCAPGSKFTKTGSRAMARNATGSAAAGAGPGDRYRSDGRSRSCASTASFCAKCCAFQASTVGN